MLLALFYGMLFICLQNASEALKDVKTGQGVLSCLTQKKWVNKACTAFKRYGGSPEWGTPVAMGGDMAHTSVTKRRLGVRVACFPPF